jgi:hypothetical protein
MGRMHKIATTIQRQWLREIVSGRKRVEYRDIKPYWTRRFAAIRAPFLLRLINGMQSNAPEVTVVVRRVRKNTRSGNFQLSLGRIVDVRHWDRKREEPARRPRPSTTRRRR